MYRKSNKFLARILRLALPVFAAILTCSANAESDRVLLNSLLERGLIAPEDYATEIKQQVNAASSSSLVSISNTVRYESPGTSNDTMADYQLVAMSEGTDNRHSAASHSTSDNHDAAGHGEHNHFEGAYMVITEEWKTPSVLVDGEKITKSEAAPSFGVGYTFGLTEKTTLGIKASIDFKNGEFGSGDISGAEKKVLEKSHYSLAVEPGFVVDENTLLFGILAYHHAQTAFEGGAQVKGISGVGYGVGFKRVLASHVFLMGELQQVKYGQVTVDGSTIKPTSNVAAVGLGYHF